jgi:hypothetical protein
VKNVPVVPAVLDKGHQRKLPPRPLAAAIARELAAFIWAINREVMGSHATAN